MHCKTLSSDGRAARIGFIYASADIHLDVSSETQAPWEKKHRVNSTSWRTIEISNKEIESKYQSQDSQVGLQWRNLDIIQVVEEP